MPRPPLPDTAFPPLLENGSCHDRFRVVLDQGLADLRSKLLSAVQECPSAAAQPTVVLRKRESKEKLSSISSAPIYPSQGYTEDTSDDDYEDEARTMKGAESETTSGMRRALPVVLETTEKLDKDGDDDDKSDDNDGDNSGEMRSRSPSKMTVHTSDGDDMKSVRPSFMHAHHYADMLHSSRLLHVTGLRTWGRTQESIVMVVICCNSLWMGWQVQYHAESGKKMVGGSAVDLIVCIFFIFEILLRLSVDGCSEFCKGHDSHWNIFDATVVSTMVLEELVQRILGDVDELEPVPVLRVLRLMRCIRILRVVRLFRTLDFFRSGRLLLMSIVKAWTFLVWVILILLAIVYVVALIISYGTLPHCVASGSHSEDHVSEAPEYSDTCYHFGTLWKSCVSLYQAMLGGVSWSTLYDALKVLDVQYPLVLTAAITFYITILQNVIAAIFVCQVMATSEIEKQHSHYDDQMKKRQMFMTEMVRAFHKLDVNQNGALCRDELTDMFQTMSASLASMDLDMNAAETLFDLLDADGSGHVKIDEFVVGCLKLQGKARAVDMERVSRDIRDVLNILKRRKDVITLPSAPPSETGKPPASSLVKAGSAIGMKSHNSVLKLTTMSHYSEVERLRKQKRVLIDRVEMRAMLVSELEDAVAIIQSACATEMWTDANSGELLSPNIVNLYHYNHHVISPVTAATEILVSGLIHGRYEEGDVMMQLCDGRILGQAEVLSSTVGSEVKVMLTKGQLSAKSSIVGTGCNITIDGRDCGVPESICNKDSVSYKELLPSNATRPDWFCTHWWGEPIIEFVDCCRAHAKARNKDAYWVCAYANRQHDLGLDVSDDPEESSFRRSMKLAEGVLLVLDHRAVPFHRIWCDFELYKIVSDKLVAAPDKMLDIITFKGKPRLLTEMPLPGEHDVEKTQRENKFPLQLLSKGAQLCLELGTATVEQDKMNILNSMGRDPTTGKVDDDLLKMNVDRANRALRSYFALAAWPQALKRGLVQNFTFGKNDTVLKLPTILAEDADRKSLHLSFGSIEEVDDTEMESIANGLPNALKDLQLSFENCYNITDIGVSTLAERLKELPLQKLRLDFVSCRRLTDSAVNALVMNLPKTITDIRLDFAFCSLITKAGVAHLAADLPRGVKHFHGTFRGTKCDEDFDSVKKLKKLS